MNDSGPQTATLTPQTSVEASSSILAGIRQMRQEKAEGDPRRLTLAVPIYQDRLAVIYRYPASGYDVAIKAVEREERSGVENARLEGAAQLLVACAVAVVGKDGDTLLDPLTNAPLAEGELPDEPIRFDQRLADAVQIDVPGEVKSKGRFIARALFSPRGPATGEYDGDLALISTSNVLFRWLNGAEVELEDEAAGE